MQIAKRAEVYLDSPKPNGAVSALQKTTFISNYH